MSTARDPRGTAHREVLLRFDAGRWQARGEQLRLSHADLRALDKLIVEHVAASGEAARVHVRFDLDTLPVWLRQYQAHYFNYVLKVPACAAREGTPA